MSVSSERLARLEQAFRWAMAEREGSWWQEVFVPPDRWDVWHRPVSLLIFAQPGMGRTMLARAWRHQASGWVVLLSSREIATLSEFADLQDWAVIARALLRWTLEQAVENLVARFQEGQPPPQWVSALLRPLWTSFQPLPVEGFLVYRYGRRLQPAVKRFLEWFTSETSESPASTLHPLEGARYLLTVARELGAHSIWVLIDLPSTPPGQQEPVFPALKALASVLQWFDLPGWVFRFLLPEDAASAFLDAAAVLRRRMAVEPLMLSLETIQNLVERRLAWATEGDWTSIQDVVASDDFLVWLRTYGQGNPRAWLSLLWPFVLERTRREHPLDAEAWRDLARAHPPPLYLDERQRRVWLGARPLQVNREEAWRLLAYLYRRRGRFCSREELYYRVLEARDRVPSREDPAWEPLVSWRGRLDTALYRLRQAVEPDPRHPQYIVVQRGRGVVLRHATDILGLSALSLGEQGVEESLL